MFDNSVRQGNIQIKNRGVGIYRIFDSALNSRIQLTDVLKVLIIYEQQCAIDLPECEVKLRW